MNDNALRSAFSEVDGNGEVRDEAHYITEHRGGDGALRDVVEYILKAQGKWEQVVREYTRERSPAR